MEQRDYLLRQIQQMAQVLAALIRKLTGIKEESPEAAGQQEETTNEMLREHFDFELKDLMQIPVTEVAEWITNQKGLHIENLELFAEVLLLHSRHQAEPKEKRKYLATAAAMLDHVDQNGNVFSLERHNKIREIKEELAKYE